MSDVNDAVPAGAGDNEPVSLSMDAAADMLERSTRDEEPRDEPATDANTEIDQQPETPAEAEGDGDLAADGADPETPEGAEDENTPQEDDDIIPIDKIDGRARIGLRSGNAWTGKQLKERIEDLEALDDHKRTFAEEQQRFQQWAGQYAQQVQQFEQIAPQAYAALQASLPEIPEEPKYDPADPFSYVEKKAAWDATVRDYNGKVAQMQQIEQQTQTLQQQRQQEAVQHQQGFLADQRQKLMAAMPELRDDAKRQEFQKDFLTYGVKTYGFQEQELNSAYDHRLMRMAKDAIAYRKLMAAKPKPSQPRPTTGAPVAQPGRRVSGQEAEQGRREELTSRVSKPGGLSMEEAARLLETAEKG